MPATLDQTDQRLIAELQRDASQRLEDLARVVQLAPSSVHERLRGLERDGVIRRWTVDVNAAALGLGVLAFIGLRATKTCADLVAALEPIPEIEEAHSVAGELSMLLKVRAGSTTALLQLIERLRRIPGIEGTVTTIVLGTQLDRPMLVQAAAAPRRGRDRAR